VRALAQDLYQRADCRVLILKLGARGVIARRAPSTDAHACFTIDAMADELVDPVGAGDALLAYATLALRATGNPVIASILGTMAAAAACAHDGNIAVRPDQLLATMALLERQVLYT
jgi:sugar/nucleoside kinase (ribokinase family)